MSVNKKFPWKKQIFLSLSSNWKLARIIAKVLKVEPLIFWALKLVRRILIPSFDAYTDIVAISPLWRETRQQKKFG